MPHFHGTEKLRRAIWCKIFMVQGYIPYLKEWYKKSLKPKPNQQSKGVNEVHSNIQRLCPGSIPSLVTHKHSPIMTEQGSLCGDQISDSRRCNSQEDRWAESAEISNKTKSET